MILYKDYELSDALFDLPCKVGITNIYPTLLKDKKQFDKYCNYILLSKKHINMPDTLDSTLKLIISYFVLVKKEENNNKKNDSLIHLEVINELENLFSIVCRENVTFEFNDYKFEFKNDLGKVLINDDNFDEIRKVILKLNMLFEPKIYKSEIERKWDEKAIKAKMKSDKPTDFADILSVVACTCHLPYSEIYKLNTIQLYINYLRCINTENTHMTQLAKTVCGDYKGVNFTDSVADSLFKNPYDDIWKSNSGFLSSFM